MGMPITPFPKVLPTISPLVGLLPIWHSRMQGWSAGQRPLRPLRAPPLLVGGQDPVAAQALVPILYEIAQILSSRLSLYTSAFSSVLLFFPASSDCE